MFSRHFIVGGEIFEVDDYSQMQRVKTFSSADEKSCKILHSRHFLCQLKTSLMIAQVATAERSELKKIQPLTKYGAKSCILEISCVNLQLPPMV